MCTNEGDVTEDRSGIEEGSVSELLKPAQSGDESALRNLWARYFDTLCQIARRKIRPGARFISDEEDIALSAMNSVFIGLRKGQFGELHDRQGLLQLLIFVVTRKINKVARYELAQKRDARRTLDQTRLANLESLPEQLEHLPDTTTTDEAIRIIGDLFVALPNELLQNVALAKLQGYRDREIASMFGVSSRTVERKLKLIRSLWTSGDSL